ncbi:MAG: right-handed parallel beta-helix repeat-containing protein [Bacteroidota bacterium]
MKSVFISLSIGLALLFVNCKKEVAPADIVILAADYGLSGKEDGTRAITAALEAVRAQGASKLVLPADTLHFYTDKALEKYIAISNNDNSLKRVVFDLSDLENFTLDGQGATLIFHGQLVPFVIEGATNLTLRHFSVDWEDPLYGQGEVIAVDQEQRSFDLAISSEWNYEVHKGTLYFKTDRGWNDTGKNLFFYPNGEGTVYHVDQYKLDPWGKWHSDSYQATDLGDRKVRIHSSLTNPLPEKGWMWVSKGTDDRSDRLSPAFRVYRSFGVNLKRVNLYHSGAMGLIAEKSGDITIDSMRVAANQQQHRAVSTTADATHFVNCRGMITIKNSYFAHMLDDATNVHGIYTKIERVDKNVLAIRQIHEEQLGFDFAEPGDSLVVADNETLMPVDTLIVAEVKWFNEGYQEIKTQTPIDPKVLPGFGVENLSWSAGLTFVNNVVEKNRARGILFSTRGKVHIAGNTFSNMMAGISISGDNNYWFESGPSREVTITDNTFVNCTSGGKGNAVIMIAPMILKPEKTNGYYGGHFSITNNHFEAFDRSIVYAMSLENLVFSDNTIVQSKTYPPLFDDKPTFEILQCGTTEISNNRFNHYQNGSIVTDSISETQLSLSGNSKRTGTIVVKNKAKGLYKIL